jgi:hypothetical protein
MKDLSIVIVSYNTKELTFQCLASIYKYTKNIDFEVIVVDNNSTDGTAEYIKEHFPKATIIENKKNIGYGAANNLGMKKAEGKYLLLLNSDTKIKDNVFNKMCKYINKQKDIDVVGPKLLNKDDSAQPSAGRDFTPLNVFLMLFGFDSLMRTSPEQIKEVDWIVGACFMLKKEVFQQTKGFDEDFFMYVEEVEWCRRIREQGYRIVFNPDFSLYHFERGSSKKGREAAIIGIYQGISLYYQKHYPENYQFLINLLLRIKAWLVISFAKLTKNKSLESTYSKALSKLN